MKSLIGLCLGFIFSFANAEKVNSNDWSQLKNPDVFVSSEHSLPSCESLEQKEAPGLPGVKAVYGAPCIGQINKSEPPPITLSDALIEKLQNSETAEDIKKLAVKYPIIKAAAVIGALCKPTGSLLKPNGIYCKYSANF